ncbi:MAG: L-malyl-CoA/beta-methylmalyl-CoA lyase [Sphingomonas bacterium]|uniref:HpcH/HpaI aldolase/citrate lyase family protein n=1 Tax=Sphingomonas bacterium TaxID=1895847 RepID=UPI00261DC5A2|nr:CoA ester lyase [Sphingomonas bacterium]MDB5706024.1 L-malyl-CoA/beta-methylmalyl-CoA lyase [Sphingomonas bacterium]
MIVRPRRSALFMPASNVRAVEKARSLDCDVVILDLEDSVAPDLKEAARDQAIAAASAGGFGHRELLVRVNALDTPWGADDCRAVADAGFAAVVLPKVSHPADLAAARTLLGSVPLWAMIETCAGMLDLPAIVASASANRLECLLAGTNDLAKEMRCAPGADRAPLLSHLAMIVTAARAAGLTALDGVCNVIEDGEILAAECAQGTRFGFDGKSLIHPAQIAAANRAYGPTTEAIAWADRIIAAFALPENADKGVIKVDGEMVELLHLEQAQRIAAMAGAIRGS